MLRKISLRRKIFLIIMIAIISLVGIVLYSFRGELKVMYLKSKNYTNKDIVVTKEILIEDIEIIKAKEGIQGQVIVLNNDNNALHYLQEELFFDDNMEIKKGNIIHVGINNRIFADSKTPLEVKFIIRIMIYLKERKTDIDGGNIVGIAGGFTRNAIEIFEGSQPIKMSIEEFEELYAQAKVLELDTEEQIDILTELWINKTGYWRRGLYGVEEKP